MHTPANRRLRTVEIMNNNTRRRGWRLGGTFVAAAATAAVLYAIGQLLTLPSGYGVEDLLGWTGPEGPEGPVGRMLEGWEAQLHGLTPWISGLYLGLDIAAFMPLYGLVFAGWWWQAQRDFAAHSSEDGEWCGWLVRAGSAMVAALWLVDLVENLAGLDRMGLPWVVLPALACAALVVVCLWRSCDVAWLSGLWKAASPAGGPRRWAWWLVVLVLVLAGSYFSTRSACTVPTPWVWAVGCVAHGMKKPLIALLALGPLLLAVWVQYGPHADTAQWPRVVAVRSALVALFWRTRYVLAALVACAALMLVMNQGRDVVYAMASHPWRQGGGSALGLWTGTLLALGLTALALWILGHSCWLWSRLALRVASRKAGGRSGEPQTEDHLAKFWARLLGVAPSLLVLGMVLAVLPQAVVLPVPEPIAVLLAFASVVVVLSIGFIWKRDRLSRGAAQPPLYYASHCLRCTIDEGLESRLFGRVTPVLLPGFALAVALACRALGQWGGESLLLPTLTLPVMFCLVAFWLGIAGWISLYEESESVPWFLIALVVIGALGTLGCTENHRVPLAPGGATLAPDRAMLLTLTLGAVLMGTSVLVAHQLSRHRATLLRMLGCAALLLGGSYAVVLGLTDRVLPPHKAPETDSLVETSIPVEAGDAIERWLLELCPNENAGACAAPKPVTVYLVMAEGGGIRSAYWTALVLQRLHAAAGGNDFDRHVFAMTGVSGGALGIAVYRACRIKASGEKDPAAANKVLGDCVDRFGSADLLAPLVGAWFFEDAVARWLPTTCKQPGCGMLSRGLWFEGAMLQARPELSLGLAESRKRLVSAAGGHQPYLLLNSTWVETGERTIASELVVDWHDFPGARDQLALLGQPDLPLVTAAHNSARFPFTNALGAVHAPDGRCGPNAYHSRRDAAPAGPPCGHLADGGYFDNSAGHTAADLLLLLQRCLSGERRGSAPLCPKLSEDSRARLAQRLTPRVIVIRNGVGLGPLPVDTCPGDGMPDARRVRGEPQPQDPMGLREPRCAKSGRLFIDALGPAWAAFAAIGTGANGRLALARPGLEGKADVELADLRDDGPLYALGWHLSPAAQREMRDRADLLAKSWPPAKRPSGP